MSLIGTAIGALVALVPAARRRPDKTDPRFIAGYDAGLHDGRLERESLERELATERNLTAHWRETAQRIARTLRAERERTLVQQEATRQAQLMAQSQQAPQPLAQQYASMQYANMQNMPQGAYDHFCNCVPSRAQVWGAQSGLVQQLNTFLGE